jgi:hypothetical protein
VTKPEPVYLELGRRKIFAAAVRWPGWCRSGRTEEEALDVLSGYQARYAPVAERAGVRFPARLGPWDVVERVKGSATTDFGAPGSVPDLDRQPVTAAEARRLAALVKAAWEELAAVTAASPASLRKGPRGGGRDRDKMVAHVENAEAAYARKMGTGVTAGDIRQHGVAVVRDGIQELLESARTSPADPRRWPAPYGARRVAWHALDHAWEMQDRSS